MSNPASKQPQVWKLVPRYIGVRGPHGGWIARARVMEAKVTPPGMHEGTAIRRDAYLLEVDTIHGKWYYGVADAYITSGLRMAVRLWPGCERDEVVSKWPKAPAKPGPEGLGRFVTSVKVGPATR